MVANGIGVLPLIKRVKAAYPDVTQTWYTDNSGALGTFDNIGSQFNALKIFGRGCINYTETSKRILFFHPNKLIERKEFCLRHGFKVYISKRYPKMLIGNDESKRDCLKDWTLMWERTLLRSLKRKENIPRIVTPQWFVQSNQKGYFCNM